MRISRAVAPEYATLRPLKPTRSPGFPVYHALEERLAAATESPDPTMAHVLAVAAGYAYSDAATMSAMLARMGLAGNHCLEVSQFVDAMLIDSTAFLVQSGDGSIVILAYRGTAPTNLIDWLTDADVYPDEIALPFPSADASFGVHAGFYRNVRATRYEIIAALRRAASGHSVLDVADTDKEPAGDATVMAKPMTALYVTGHSLGGAMASLMSVMLAVEPEYVENFAAAFRGAYTFGAPMVGSPAFAAHCDELEFLRRNVIRYVYRRDVVPHLPPRDSDAFRHFGREFRYERSYPWPETTTQPVEQMGHLSSLLEVPLGFVARQFKLLRGIPFQYSINDHGPQHYIAALTPPGVPNEFGDAYVIPS